MPFAAGAAGSTDDLPDRIGRSWRELRRGAATEAILHEVFGVGDHAVEPAQMDVLDLLAVQGDRRMSNVAASLRIDPSTVTRLIQRMEANGYAVRKPGTGDGRVVTLSMTAAGRRVHEAVAARRRAVLESLLASFDDSDREALAVLLERFVHCVDRHTGAETTATTSG